MRRWNILFLFATLVLATQLSCGTAYANKSSVTVQVPSEAPKDSEVVVTVNVNHKGNNFLHHTEWVYVTVNDKEVGRWSYSATSLPPDGVFSKAVKVTIAGDLNIRAEASCNVHGSAGPATAKVAVSTR